MVRRPKDPQALQQFHAGGWCSEHYASLLTQSEGLAAKATYEATTTLQSAGVVTLMTKSNMWAGGTSLIAQTLYVAGPAKPPSLATSGPVGMSGILYFSH